MLLKNNIWRAVAAVSLSVSGGFASAQSADVVSNIAAARYDAVGYAQAGDMAALAGFSAHHATLPPNSFVEVTALDSGHTVLVQIVEGPPPVQPVLLRLSLQAARALGSTGGQMLAVRIRRTNPPGIDQQALREGKAASPRLDSPPILLTALRKRLPQVPADLPKILPPTPALTPAKAAASKPGASYPPPVANLPAKAGSAKAAPPPDGGQSLIAKPAVAGLLYVQVAALSAADAAAVLAQKVGGHVERAGALYRVRLGPFRDAAAANRARDVAVQRGYKDARITR